MKIFKCYFRVSKLGKCFTSWYSVKSITKTGIYMVEYDSKIERATFFHNGKQINIIELFELIDLNEKVLLRDWKIRKFLM